MRTMNCCNNNTAKKNSESTIKNIFHQLIASVTCRLAENERLCSIGMRNYEFLRDLLQSVVVYKSPMLWFRPCKHIILTSDWTFLSDIDMSG